MMVGRLILVLAGVLVVSEVYAGKYNPVLSVGDAAPAWTDLAGVDGKKHSLADLQEFDAVVLVFTCNSCPYSVEYEDRIMALTREFAARNVAVVAVNVNKVPEDSFEEMQRRAREKKFNFPYVFDETQQIARDYGATYTPEFFVLDRQRKIAYMGSLDDSPDAAQVQVRHVANALTATLDGREAEVAETVAIGCRIRLERQRRRKSDGR